MRIKGYLLKIVFKKALFLKIILLDTCINQSFGFVNQLTARYVINFLFNLYKNISILCRTMNKQEIIFHTPNISVPHSATIGKKRFFLTLKEIIYSRYIYYRTNCIALLKSVTARRLILIYLPSLAVWKKDLVVLDMELDVQIEGRFNIWERFIKVP